ncbi:MAG: class I SAM-dependent methyltransferase [Xanthobacteraceae bacterium]|jgi:SAM-dependent methyltransferase
MSVFGEDYSEYYDLLYADKDYVAEVAFVRDIIQRHKPNARSILDLGCGSARHAVEFARAGLMVTGVERSSDMIARAKDRIGRLSPDLCGLLTLVEGDATNYAATTRYDVVVSLFHVVSYQTSNNALAGIFRCARLALSASGLFVFDFWYGPAVLTKQPAVRVRRVATPNVRLTRIAEPEHQFDRNVVNIKYTIMTVDQRNGRSEEMVEVHSMRYLFLPEIEMLASQHDFEVIEVGGWLTGRLDEHHWSGYAAVRARPTASCN